MEIDAVAHRVTDDEVDWALAQHLIRDPIFPEPRESSLGCLSHGQSLATGKSSVTWAVTWAVKVRYPCS